MWNSGKCHCSVDPSTNLNFLHPWVWASKFNFYFHYFCVDLCVCVSYGIRCLRCFRVLWSGEKIASAQKYHSLVLSFAKMHISQTFLCEMSRAQVVITSIRYVPQQSKKDPSQFPKLSLYQFKHAKCIILHHTMLVYISCSEVKVTELWLHTTCVWRCVYVSHVLCDLCWSHWSLLSKQTCYKDNRARVTHALTQGGCWGKTETMWVVSVCSALEPQGIHSLEYMCVKDLYSVNRVKLQCN